MKKACLSILILLLCGSLGRTQTVVVEDAGTSSSTVNVVVTKAPLLPGNLRTCAQEGCIGGSVAEVQALVHYHATEDDVNKTLVIPVADFKSPITFMSRFLGGVNVMIFRNVLGWRTWTLPSYTIRANRFQQSFVEDMQHASFPGLLSNIILTPQDQSFFGYIQQIHWDRQTHLAVIYVGKDEKPAWETDAAKTAFALTRYIYKRNALYGCPNTPVSPPPPLAVFADTTFDAWYREEGSTSRVPPTSTSSNAFDLEECYYPVVVYDFTGKVTERSDHFWQQMLSSTDEAEQPVVLVDVEGVFLQSNQSTSVVRHSERMWVASHPSPASSYYQLQIDINPANGLVNAVDIIEESLTDLPMPAQTMLYFEDVERVRQYAREAYDASLLEETGAKTETMPAAVTEDGFRFCDVQECAIGNLAADALRWKQGAEIAILPSFFFRGQGWPEGEVRLLELNENLQYVGQRCAGVMTGLSVHRAIEYSINANVFDGYYESQDTLLNKQGLFHVSGMKYAFNHNLQNEKVLSIEVWDEDTQNYQPLERTRLYRFVSGSHLCFTFKGFPPFFTDLLTADGEVPGQRVTDVSYVEDMKEYLLEFYVNNTYTPTIEDRIREDPGNTDAIPLIDSTDCVYGAEWWSNSYLRCEECPSYDNVQFSSNNTRLVGVAYGAETLTAQLVMVNNEAFALSVRLDILAVPEYISINVETGHLEGNGTLVLSSGESLLFDIAFDTTDRDPGTDTSSLIIDFYPATSREGCPQQNVRHNIVAQLSLDADMNYLKGVAAFGYTSAAIIIGTAVSFTMWIWHNRKVQVVLSMQPPFLLTLCFGVILIATSIVPFSIDDQNASQAVCDSACMAIPWFLSLGLTVCALALHSKLWRINQLLLSSQPRRRTVREKDVVWPLVAVVLLNTAFLTVWTAVDPLKWKRFPIGGQMLRSYGKCVLSDDSQTGRAMMICIVILCSTSFLAMGWQAIKARNISTEFSESTHLGLVVFSWTQLSVVGVPVLFLVEESNTVVRYGLAVGLLFAACMSVLLFIFLPIIYISHRPNSRASVRLSGIKLTSSQLAIALSGSATDKWNQRSNCGSSSMFFEKRQQDGNIDASKMPKQLPGVPESSIQSLSHLPPMNSLSHGSLSKTDGRDVLNGEFEIPQARSLAVSSLTNFVPSNCEVVDGEIDPESSKRTQDD